MATTSVSNQTKRVRWLLGGVGLLAALTVVLFSTRTSLVESAGAGGVLGLFFAVGSLFLLGAHAIWRRNHKGTVRLAMATLLGGLLALSTSALLSRANRTEAAEVATSDTTYAPGERESRVEQANARADNAAWIGLLGVLPSLGALLGLAIAIGDRREMTPLLPKPVAAPGPPTSPAVGAGPMAGAAPLDAPPLPINAIWVVLFAGFATLVLAVVWSVGALR